MLKQHLVTTSTCACKNQPLVKNVCTPLWFDSKGIKCMEKEEYEKQKVALGMDVEVKMWLEHCRSTAIRPGKPS